MTSLSVKNKRNYQEDRISSSNGIYSIFDGHGGSEASEYCRNNFNQKVKFITKNSFLVACSQIAEECKHIKSGTTLVSCGIKDNKIITANIGDSEAVLFKQYGTYVVLTELHNPNKNHQEIARARKDGANVSKCYGDCYRLRNSDEGGISLTRAIGDYEYIPYGMVATPYISETEYESGDILVIASDGFWDTMPYDYVSKIIFNDATCSSLVRDAINKKSTDNISIILKKL